MKCVIPNSLHRASSSHLVNKSKKRHCALSSPTAIGVPPTTPVVSVSMSVIKQTVPSTNIVLCTKSLDTAFRRVLRKLLVLVPVNAVNGTTWSRPSTVFVPQKEVLVRPCPGVFVCKELVPESARTLDIRAQSQAESHRIRA